MPREPRAAVNGKKQLTLIEALHNPYPRSTVGNGVGQLVFVTVTFACTAAAVAAVASATAPKRAETRTISTITIKTALQESDLEVRATGGQPQQVHSTSLYYSLVVSPKASVVPSSILRVQRMR